MIAALYVQRGGVYWNLEGVEAMRDAAIADHVFTSAQTITLRANAARLLSKGGTDG